MSQPSMNMHYSWVDRHQRYSEYRYTGWKWEFIRWMPNGWRPQQSRGPQQQPQNSPAASAQAFQQQPALAQASSGSYVGFAAQPTRYSVPSTTSYAGSRPSMMISPSPQAYKPRTDSLDTSRFPKGEGATVQGHYNAALGTAPNNLHYEEFDKSYFVRDRMFFAEGRVFAVILTEAGSKAPAATSYNTSLSEVRYPGHVAPNESRRFVVVRARREYCFACPIFTYSGRATTKRGVRPEEHGIAYSEGMEPRLVAGENGIKKPSIAVAMASGVPNLVISSRIYYGIHHPVQYNVKAKDIGKVLPYHLPVLIGNWRAEDESETRQSAEVTATAEDTAVADSDNDGDLSDKRSTAISQDFPRSPSSYQDPHLYHPKKNVYGYDTKINPHMYHPIHNQYGYHPENNTHGYHPSSNPYSYHPTHNKHGYHPQLAPFCYHPQFSPHGYHGLQNVHGYHPDVTPYNYHPQSNSYGYHPTQNKFAYHPQNNPYGYHPTYNPQGYHPKWQPSGSYGAHDDIEYEEAEDEDSAEEDDDELILR